jgi:hypothetical protein
MGLGQALSLAAYYYSLKLNVCEFNADEIFLLETKEGEGVAVACASFTVKILSILNLLSMFSVSLDS